MKNLDPCPACGSHNIGWGAYYHVALVCNICTFKMWPYDDFASEEMYYREWNNLKIIDQIIKDLKNEIENNKDPELKNRLSHHERQKKDIEKAKEELNKLK